MKARFGALAACLLAITSCAATAPFGAGSGSPNPTSSARAFPTPTDASSSRVIPEPTSVPTPALTSASDARTTAVTAVAGLSCSLPVGLFKSGAGFGAFVNFPAAHFHDDTAGSQLVSKGGVAVTVLQPGLDGTAPGPVWDWPAHRWIPAMNPQVLSPDGSAYVYMQETGVNGVMTSARLRVVTVSTGNDRLLPSTGPYDLPIAWTNDGIYIATYGFEVSTAGLRLINPATGAQHVITADGSWLFVSNGAAWGFTPYIGGPSAPKPHVVNRLDLATGKVTLWYSAPEPHNVHVAAIDLAGRPIIVVDEYHVFRLVGPNQAQPLFNSPVPIWDDTSPQVDSHGLWFVGAWPDLESLGEVWLYSDTAGLHKVAETGQSIDSVEGPCR